MASFRAVMPWSIPTTTRDGQIECMDAMRSMMSGDQYALPAQSAYWWGCAFKYLWRWRRKNGIQDLQKCKQCIDYLISETEGKK